MKRISVYDIVKSVIYIIGLGFTAYLILSSGLVDSHTPPPGFILPLFIMFLAMLWYITDLVIIRFYKSVNINHYVNIWGLFVNFLIVFLIIVEAL